ncbi:MAG: hypothetical protein V9E98_02285 [Candidatus Nanopelagicales bacterium]
MTGPSQQWLPPTGPPVATDPPVRKVWPRILFWGGITLMILGFLGLMGDWATRTWEMNQLLSRIEKSEDAMRVAQDDIGAVDLPDDAAEPDKRAAIQELEDAAADGRDSIRSAGQQVAAVSFLPWHTELIGAQAAYLDHNGAWVEYLDRGAEQPLTLFGDDNRIEPTWRAAEIALRIAAPIPALPPIPQRLDSIFTDEEPEDVPGGIPA